MWRSEFWIRLPVSGPPMALRRGSRCPTKPDRTHQYGKDGVKDCGAQFDKQ